MLVIIYMNFRKTASTQPLCQTVGLSAGWWLGRWVGGCLGGWLGVCNMSRITKTPDDDSKIGRDRPGIVGNWVLGCCFSMTDGMVVLDSVPFFSSPSARLMHSAHWHARWLAFGMPPLKTSGFSQSDPFTSRVRPKQWASAFWCKIQLKDTFWDRSQDRDEQENKNEWFTLKM